MERWGFYEFEHEEIFGGAVPLRLVDINILKYFGIDGIVDLTEEISWFVELYSKEGIDYLHLPTPDLESSSIEDIYKFLEFYSHHNHIYIHCHVGEGRTGMFLSCFLIYKYKLDAQEVIRMVRRRRKHSVHTREQEGLIYEFARLNGQKTEYNQFLTYRSFLDKPSITTYEGKYEDPSYGEIHSVIVSFDGKDYEFSNIDSSEKKLDFRIDEEDDILNIYANEVKFEEVSKILNLFKLNAINEINCIINIDYTGKIFNYPNPDIFYNVKRRFYGPIVGIHIFEVELDRRLERRKEIVYRDCYHPKDIKEDCLRMKIGFKIEKDEIISKEEVNPV